MTEQTTIRAMMDVARDWGPLWTCVGLYLLHQIIQGWHFKRKRAAYSEADKQRDIEIATLRQSKGKMLTDISDLKIEHEKQFSNFRVELEKRTTYNWMESKVLPRIDELTKTVHEFKSTVELLIKQGLGNK